MVSRKWSLPLLQLAGLNPCYISLDAEAGERDCLSLFPVGYGDDYVEEESVEDEEVKVPTLLFWQGNDLFRIFALRIISPWTTTVSLTNEPARKYFALFQADH